VVLEIRLLAHFFRMTKGSYLTGLGWMWEKIYKGWSEDPNRPSSVCSTRGMLSRREYSRKAGKISSFRVGFVSSSETYIPIELPTDFFAPSLL